MFLFEDVFSYLNIITVHELNIFYHRLIKSFKSGQNSVNNFGSRIRHITLFGLTFLMNIMSCLGAFSTLRSSWAMSLGMLTCLSLLWLSWRSIRVWRISCTIRRIPASWTSDMRSKGSRKAEGKALTISMVLYLVATFSKVFINIVWRRTSRDSLQYNKTFILSFIFIHQKE